MGKKEFKDLNPGETFDPGYAVCSDDQPQFIEGRPRLWMKTAEDKGVFLPNGTIINVLPNQMVRITPVKMEELIP